MATGRQGKTIRVDQDVSADIEAMLAEIPDLHTDKRRKFTEKEDRLLLAGWGKKSQISLARYIGCSVETLKRRRGELLEGRA